MNHSPFQRNKTANRETAKRSGYNIHIVFVNTLGKTTVFALPVEGLLFSLKLG